MNSIGERAIGFEEENEETTELVTQSTIEDGPTESDEHDEQDQDELQEAYGDINADEFNEAIRIVEEADHQAIIEEEPIEGAIVTRSRANPQRFQLEQDADRYVEYVAMGWREPEPQDIGRVVFNRGFRRTEGRAISSRQERRYETLTFHAVKPTWSRLTSISTRR